MKLAIYSLLIFVVLFSSCDKEEPLKKSGYFILTELQNADYKSAEHQYDESIKTSFSLGDIKASKEFYFILSNGGDSPIYNIRLSSDNSVFKVTPESISSLSGKLSIEINDLIPLISVGIIHGTKLNGVGYTELLPMNENHSTITITGKTIENGDTVNLVSEFNLRINAKVLNIQLFDDENEIDLPNPIGQVHCNLGQFRYYRVSNNLIIKNIGNVPFDLTTYISSLGTFTKDGESLTILPNELNTIEMHNGFVIYEMDSDGTICDYERINLENNGKGYFGIEYPKEMPAPIDSTYTIR